MAVTYGVVTTGVVVDATVLSWYWSRGITAVQTGVLASLPYVLVVARTGTAGTATAERLLGWPSFCRGQDVPPRPVEIDNPLP